MKGVKLCCQRDTASSKMGERRGLRSGKTGTPDRQTAKHRYVLVGAGQKDRCTQMCRTCSRPKPTHFSIVALAGSYPSGIPTRSSGGFPAVGRASSSKRKAGEQVCAYAMELWFRSFLRWISLSNTANNRVGPRSDITSTCFAAAQA